MMLDRLLADHGTWVECERIGFDDVEADPDSAPQFPAAPEGIGYRARSRRPVSRLQQGARASIHRDPVPTSTTVTPSSGPAARAIRLVRFRSNRRVWPSDLRASSPCVDDGPEAAEDRQSDSLVQAGTADPRRKPNGGDETVGPCVPSPLCRRRHRDREKVRTNGSPSVTFTASSNAMVLMGTSA